MPAIHLRPYDMDDVPAIVEAALESVAEIEPWMPWCHARYNIDDAQGWVALATRQRKEELAYEFAICDATDGRLLGGCGVNNVSRDHPFANLGYWVRTSASRQGVAPAAVKLAEAWAFANTTLERLEIVAAVGNTRSQRVAEKAGAHREGVLRSRLLLHGKMHDALIFSLVRGASECQ